MIPKTILSLFDFTGTWAAPFEEAGHTVIQLDIKHDPELADVARFDVGHFTEELEIDWVDAIIAAPPCTDFTCAGNQYWKQKDLDGRTAASVHLVEQVLRCVEYWKPDWWVLENPIGRLPSLVPALGKPRLSFDPCDFAGWLELTELEQVRLEKISRKRIDRITEADAMLTRKANTYTKRTALWGDFTVPEFRRRPAIRTSKQGSWLQRLGGKSEATKAARSETPAGFAQAFYHANEWTPEREDELEARRESEEAA